MMHFLTMRKLVIFFCTIIFFIKGLSQNREADSLTSLLNKATEDTARVDLLNQLAVSYFDISPDDARKYSNEAMQLAEKAEYTRGLAYALKNTGITYFLNADYVQTLDYWNQSLEQFEKVDDKKGIANILSNIGAVFSNGGDDAKALDFYLRALKYTEQTNDTLRLVTVLNNIGSVYINNPFTHDTALNYYLKALPLCEKLGDNDAIGTITVNIGEIYLEKGNDSLALTYFQRSLKAYENSRNLPYSLNDIARVYIKRKEYATAIAYHRQALELSEKLSARLEISQSYQGLANVYMQTNDLSKALEAYKNAERIAKEIAANYELEKIYRGLSNIYGQLHDYPNGYKYQRLLTSIKDTLYSAEKDKKVASLQFNFEIQKKQTEIDQLTRNKTMNDLELKTQRTVKNSLIAVLSLVLLLVFILFRNYRIKDKTNAQLDSQKKELEHTLAELKTTQTQLIQSEKMASLGELTAGIAHEIQNPLNFVNNFSEVSTEMFDEMKTELAAGNHAEVTEIADDIQRNLDKILYHGRRADAIVKGMLQHSRTSSGKKEPADINAIADEYLRLAYHGLRAKDKSFNAEIKTSFDKNIGIINIMPQDVGRVLLNLFNNAFYAVNEKKKLLAEGYQPTIKITTTKLNGNNIEVRVEDNGKGIPQHIISKIFQPFYTTKPTGQGTGLGLSLSYDIITKEHGGNIKVESKEGEGTTFTIHLPLTET